MTACHIKYRVASCYMRDGCRVCGGGGMGMCVEKWGLGYEEGGGMKRKWRGGGVLEGEEFGFEGEAKVMFT